MAQKRTNSHPSSKEGLGLRLWWGYKPFFANTQRHKNIDNRHIFKEQKILRFNSNCSRICCCGFVRLTRQHIGTDTQGKDTHYKQIHTDTHTAAHLKVWGVPGLVLPRICEIWRAAVGREFLGVRISSAVIKTPNHQLAFPPPTIEPWKLPKSPSRSPAMVSWRCWGPRTGEVVVRTQDWWRITKPRWRPFAAKLTAAELRSNVVLPVLAANIIGIIITLQQSSLTGFILTWINGCPGYCPACSRFWAILGPGRFTRFHQTGNLLTSCSDCDRGPAASIPPGFLLQSNHYFIIEGHFKR